MHHWPVILSHSYYYLIASYSQNLEYVHRDTVIGCVLYRAHAWWCLSVWSLRVWLNFVNPWKQKLKICLELFTIRRCKSWWAQHQWILPGLIWLRVAKSVGMPYALVVPRRDTKGTRSVPFYIMFLLCLGCHIHYLILWSISQIFDSVPCVVVIGDHTQFVLHSFHLILSRNLMYLIAWKINTVYCDLLVVIFLFMLFFLPLVNRD